MKKRYIKDGYATSYLQYLVIFCTRFRRKVFLIPGVSIRFEELATDVCKKMNIRIDSVICDEETKEKVLLNFKIDKKRKLIVSMGDVQRSNRLFEWNVL